MLKSLRLSLLGIALLLCSSAQAAVTPVGVAILAPVQFPPGDFTVAGARASVFWGRHRNVYGFDLGAIGNITEQNFVGIGVSGLFNKTQGLTTILGLQAAGAANVNVQKTRVFGVQATLGVNYNPAETLVVGFQLAPISNFSPHTTLWGVQAGLYNKALNVYGFQLGLINVADSLHGIQIGLLNFNKKGPFAVSPIINIGF